MSDTGVTTEPNVAEMELANQRAQFEVLELEYQAISKGERETRRELEASPLYQAWLRNDAARADASQALRACGERLMALERAQKPDPIPGYNEAGGAR